MSSLGQVPEFYFRYCENGDFPPRERWNSLRFKKKEAKARKREKKLILKKAAINHSHYIYGKIKKKKLCIKIFP